MKPTNVLCALIFAAGIVACSPADESPSLPPPSSPPPAAPEVNPLALTGFAPTTNEIYCSFYMIGEDGLRGERVFITEIAGVPAPAHVGLEGQPVAMTQVSKADDAATQVWRYENAERGFQVELQITEMAKGFETRDYEGTIQVTRPAEGALKAIIGSCGV